MRVKWVRIQAISSSRAKITDMMDFAWNRLRIFKIFFRFTIPQAAFPSCLMS